MLLRWSLIFLTILSLLVPLAACEIEEDEDSGDRDDSDPDEPGTCFFKCTPTGGYFYYGCYYNLDDVTLCSTKANEFCEGYSNNVEMFSLVRGCYDCDEDCAPSWYPED